MYISLATLEKHASRFVQAHPGCTKGDVNAELERLIEVTYRNETFEDEEYLDDHVTQIINRVNPIPPFTRRIPCLRYYHVGQNHEDVDEFKVSPSLYFEFSSPTRKAIYRDNPSDITWMTTTQLRILCKSLGLKSTGSGQELIETIFVL